MHITSSLKMAINILIYLSLQEKGKYTLRMELAEKLGFPKDYISKLLGMLVKNQILIAAKGKSGGYSMARSADKITLLEIHESIEGKIEITDCKTEKFACEFIGDICPILETYKDLFLMVRETLARKTLQQMVDVLVQPAELKRCR